MEDKHNCELSFKIISNIWNSFKFKKRDLRYEKLYDPLMDTEFNCVVCQAFVSRGKYCVNCIYNHQAQIAKSVVDWVVGEK